MSEHQETLAALRRIAEVLERLEAKLSTPKPTLVGGSDTDLLSLAQVDRELRKEHGFAARQIAAGVLACVVDPRNPDRKKVARWQLRQWQERQAGERAA
jgi:hypothetical protein